VYLCTPCCCSGMGLWWWWWPGCGWSVSPCVVCGVRVAYVVPAPTRSPAPGSRLQRPQTPDSSRQPADSGLRSPAGMRCARQSSVPSPPGPVSGICDLGYLGLGSACHCPWLLAAVHRQIADRKYRRALRAAAT
jgi:hypothetical protein